MNKSECIGLARVATDNGYYKICKFPPFKFEVARGSKVVLSEGDVYLIGVVKECCTVERISPEYYMITGRAEIRDRIIGTLDEFENEEGDE